MNIFKNIAQWFSGLATAFAHEWHAVFHDMGVLVFFIGLPLFYPIVYTLIYNPEVVRELPIVVVDDCRTASSRKLVTDAAASPSVVIYDYAANMSDAKRIIAEGDAFGILQIPHNYGKKIGRMEQANATLYCEMSLLLRYRTLMSAFTDVQMKEISDITADRSAMLGEAASSLSGGLPINNQANMIGDPEQGFASFVMPGILVLILQQSMVLGITMLSGTSRERRRRNGGKDPEMVTAPMSAIVWGRTLCYSIFYIAPTIFLLHYIPVIFDLPHIGSAVDYLLYMVPLVLASAFFGQTISYFVHDRESSFIVMVFTSVIFLFLSGLTWPRFAMPEIWQWLGDAIPAVWGVQGFVSINSNAGTLADNVTGYSWLWALTAIYFLTAWFVQCRIAKRGQ
jgi:ABC-2 type transport system permease protein